MQNPTTNDPNMQRDRDRGPEEIRRDIRQTRGEMDRTVDELVDRFSVGNLVDEAWQRMRRTGGGGPDLGTMLREHPVPIALVGLGLGWLAAERTSGRSVTTDTFGNGNQTNGHGGSPRQSGWGRTRDGSGHGQTDRDGQMDGNGAVNGDGFADKVSEQASEAMSTARETVSDMKEGTKAAGSRTRAGLKEFLAESPLTAGSIVFGLGLASGLALPSSELENREIGEVSDRLRSKASQLGSEAADRAGEIGHEVVDTAMSETRNQVDDLRDEGERNDKNKSQDTDPSNTRIDPPSRT